MTKDNDQAKRQLAEALAKLTGIDLPDGELDVRIINMSDDPDPETLAAMASIVLGELWNNIGGELGRLGALTLALSDTKTETGRDFLKLQRAIVEMVRLNFQIGKVLHLIDDEAIAQQETTLTSIEAKAALQLALGGE